MQNSSFNDSLNLWLSVRSLNKKPRTKEFYADVHKIIEAHWHEPQIEIAGISADDILFFAGHVAHHCPSRWNTIVSAFQSITPGFFPPDRRLHLLKRKPLRMRNFNPPGQAQFAALLAECDSERHGPKSHSGLIVRFLCLTGCRISEARGLTWKNIFPDRVEVPAELAKSGKRRSIPALEGLPEVLDRLRLIGDGEHVLPQGNARKAIEAACVRAGVVNMSHHCFRHYFATRCIESGVDVPTVARWLGHQDGGALLSKTYFHLLDAHSHAMAAKVKIAA